jgi:SAM-dependent methyltransferase
MKTKQEQLKLPNNYIFNKVISNEDTGDDFWSESTTTQYTYLYQGPIYEKAIEIIKRNDSKIVVDLGCGTGFKTIKYLNDLNCKVYGLDQNSGIKKAKEEKSNIDFRIIDFETNQLQEFFKEVQPDFVIFSDVIEHLEYPDIALANLYSFMPSNAKLLVSTPDRDFVDNSIPLGPPINPRHVQEWNFLELQNLLEENKFNVIDYGHLLPRKYLFNIMEILRFFYRMVRFKKIPDSRSSMYFVLNKG